MTDDEVNAEIERLKGVSFREPFESGLCDLYFASSPAQAARLRRAVRAQEFGVAKPWQHSTAYGRSDLPIWRRYWEALVMSSIVADGVVDDRDVLMGMARSYHILRACGRDADAVVLTLTSVSGAGYAELLRGFVARAPDEKSPESFGFRIVHVDGMPAIEEIP